MHDKGIHIICYSHHINATAWCDFGKGSCTLVRFQSNFDPVENANSIHYLIALKVRSHQCDPSLSQQLVIIVEFVFIPATYVCFVFFFSYSEEVCKRGFTVIVDMRGSKWDSIKPLLKILQESFPCCIHVALIIKPDNFWQKQRTNFGSSKFEFEVGIVFSFFSLTVYKYIYFFNINHANVCSFWFSFYAVSGALDRLYMIHFLAFIQGRLPRHHNTVYSTSGTDQAKVFQICTEIDLRD